MNGVGVVELCLIALFALLFIGPKELIAVFRFCVKWWFILQKQGGKIRAEIFDTPEIRKMIAEIRHEVYGEEEQPSPPEQNSERDNH